MGGGVASTSRVVGLLLLAFLATGCGRAQPEADAVARSVVDIPGDGSSVSGTVSLPPPATAGTFVTDGVVCLRSGPAADVVAVAPVEPFGGLEVTDFRLYELAPDDPVDGWYARPLGDTPLAAGTRVVDAKCGSDVPAYLAVEVTRAGTGPAGARAFRVEYDAGLTDETLTMRQGLTVCPERIITSVTCDR